MPEATNLARHTAELASHDVGRLEIPLGSNTDNGGPIDQALAYCALAPGHAYCASCCSHWVHLAAVDLGVTPTFRKSGSAVHLFQLNPSLQIPKDQLQASDLPCIGINVDADGIHGHAFLVVGLDESTGTLTTVDPNSDPHGSREGTGIYLLQRRNASDSNRLGYLRIS